MTESGGWRTAWPYLLPALLAAAVFLLFPLGGTLVTSFFRDVSFLPTRFIGGGNYRALLRDPAFWQAFRFTVFFVAASVPLETALGLVFALLLNQVSGAGRSGRLRAGFLRAAVLIPWAVPAAVSARTFELIYQYHAGLVNALLSRWGGMAPVNWLGSAPGAFFALVLADAWKTTPFAAILFLAGLAAIPEDVQRQARVDGAHFTQRFFRVTLPLLRPIFLVVVLFRGIDALRVFDLNYVLTGGGPGGATTSLSLFGYRLYLAGDYGLGAAASMVLFALSFALAWVYARRGWAQGAV